MQDQRKILLVGDTIPVSAAKLCFVLVTMAASQSIPSIHFLSYLLFFFFFLFFGPAASNLCFYRQASVDNRNRIYTLTKEHVFWDQSGVFHFATGFFFFFFFLMWSRCGLFLFFFFLSWERGEDESCLLCWIQLSVVWRPSIVTHAAMKRRVLVPSVLKGARQGQRQEISRLRKKHGSGTSDGSIKNIPASRAVGSRRRKPSQVDMLSQTICAEHFDSLARWPVAWMAADVGSAFEVAIYICQVQICEELLLRLVSNKGEP